MKRETKNIVGRTAKTIADAISNIADAKAKYTAAIAACEKTARAAEEKMAAAVSKEDTAAFIAAKKEKVDAESEREMYQLRLTQITGEGIISDADAKQLLDGLKAAEQDEFQTLAKEVMAAAKHITELKRGYDEALTELNDMNAALPTIKPGMQYAPLAIRMGDPAFSFAANAERFLQNYKIS